MKTPLTILLCAFVGSLACAEDESKKDSMTVEYQSVGPFPTHGVTMAGALKALGVSLDKIDYLKLVGDESSMTTGLSKKVKIDEWFWDRYFETAEPYKYWVSSGNRRLINRDRLFIDPPEPRRSSMSFAISSEHFQADRGANSPLKAGQFPPIPSEFAATDRSSLPSRQ